MLLLALAAAAVYRFTRLGVWPPGLYRDEAYNALDALNVLRGELALFFTANNGREPIYIYLVALSIALFGRTALAVRLPAAAIGTLATLPTYLLGRVWFGRVAGLLAAFLWATTFWPVHLGRIGLRAGLLAPLLALALWAGTLAYRRGRGRLWFVAGLLYGLTFYTYLAARLTPAFLLLLGIYLLLTGRGRRLWSDGRVLWAALGTALVLAPLGLLVLNDPSILLGRAGQVSVLSPEVNGGDLIGTLLRQTGDALGMFVWRGDVILRHNALWPNIALLGHNALLGYDAVLPSDNPAGRPVFDWLMAGPFLVGVGWCLRHWRRPPAMALLLWTAVMILPTILAEDTPHFLRAAGLLPGVVLFPAIGLAALWDWARLPVAPRRGAVIALLAGSALLTARDYAIYGQQPDVGYLFEAAAAQLAYDAAAEPPATTVYLDRRYPEGWPSVRYLLGERPVAAFAEGETIPPVSGPAVFYVWPFASLDNIRAAVPASGTLLLSEGPRGRGDLEPQAYPLYLRIGFEPGAAAGERADNFDNRFILRRASASLPEPTLLQVDLAWEPTTPPEVLPSAFVQVVGPNGLIGQRDAPPGGGYWPAEGWRPGLVIAERRLIELSEPFDPARHQIITGLYEPESGARLPVLDAGYNPIDDKITIQPRALP